MKRVYFTRDRSMVVAFFKDAGASHDPNRRKRLDAIVGSYNPILRDDGEYWRNLYCWPSGVVVAPELGVVMPSYPGNFFFQSGDLKDQEKKGKWFSSPKLRRCLPPDEKGSWLNYLHVCVLIARAVRKMHLTGLAHSDLSSNNVLVDPSSNSISVIDVDSLVVPSIYPPDVLGTPGYIAPEVLRTAHLPLDDPGRFLPCNYTDLHALGVLIYEYLLRRHPLLGPKIHDPVSPETDDHLAMGERAVFIEHPDDPSNRPRKLGVGYESLGRHLVDVIRKAFVDGLHDRHLRPTAIDWEGALMKTADWLLPCPNENCPEQWFVYLEGSPLECPWCGTQYHEPIPYLEFHYLWKEREFNEKHGLIAWEGRVRTLHEWHIMRHLIPDERLGDEAKKPVAYLRKYNGQWVLQNKSLTNLRSSRGEVVAPGRGIVLDEGCRVELDPGNDNARILVVRMVK